MPVSPQKQSPRPPARTPPNGKPGSVLSRAVDVSTLKAGPIKFGVYGPNRVGKTTLACTFPKPLLLVSVEPDRTGGADSVKGVEGVSLVQPATVDEFRQLAGELTAGGHGFVGVVVDSATSLADMVLRKLLGLEDDPTMIKYGQVSRQTYMDRAEETRNLLRPFMNLPLDVVVTAKEKDHNPEKGDGAKPKIVHGKFAEARIESFFSFDAAGSGTAGWLADCCGLIGRLYVDKEVKAHPVLLNGKPVVDKETGEPKVRYEETGRYVRRLLTQLHPNFAAGVRGRPENVPPYIEEPTYEKIRAVIDGTYGP